MKFGALTILIPTLVFASGSVFAEQIQVLKPCHSWPQTLDGLTRHQRDLVKGAVSEAADLSLFECQSVEDNINTSAIVHYATESEFVLCEDGVVESTQAFVDLYVTGKQVRQVTSWTQYACHRD